MYVHFNNMMPISYQQTETTCLADNSLCTSMLVGLADTSLCTSMLVGLADTSLCTYMLVGLVWQFHNTHVYIAPETPFITQRKKPTQLFSKLSRVLSLRNTLHTIIRKISPKFLSLRYIDITSTVQEKTLEVIKCMTKYKKYS